MFYVDLATYLYIYLSKLSNIKLKTNKHGGDKWQFCNIFIQWFHIQGKFVCGPDICFSVKCHPAICKENEEETQGGWCNCCDVCTTILRKGEKCYQLLYLGGPPRTVVCAEGLECIMGVCADPNTTN
ncbi:fungal protease inhibitor-1 [Aethina tumida]|uniref:fungal protease inhibitor-1 n=1 Tax=Aethina tumida TaxID=116153 RepID=UPI002147BD93|nr:fungal protease inhibitor-1 [Aethina tumida]